MKAIQTLQLKTSFPTVWANLAFQNQVLRKFSLGALVVAAVSLILTLSLVHRKPVIIPLDAQANVVSMTAATPIEQAANQAAKQYLNYRYAWTPTDLAGHVAFAKNFIAPESVGAFEKSMEKLVKFAKEKSVSQRVYPTAIEVNAKLNRVSVTADRFTEIQGLKAASTLRVILTYESGPRTSENPWGIYVVKENELE